ncbi:MAG: magnesium/cobalt transporter CorA [Syntrophales bacterium]
MKRWMKNRSKKAGMPPGSLIHIGDITTEKARITVLRYSESEANLEEISSLAECHILKEGPEITWIHIDGVHDTKILEELGNCYNIHPLTLEDILNTDQRPKMEDYGRYIFIVLKALHEKAHPELIGSQQISIIMGKDLVISIFEREETFLKPVRERILSGKGRIRNFGADYLAYIIMDCVVDQYFSIMETVGESTEDMEESLMTNPAPDTLHNLQHLKQEMIFLRKNVWPLREMLSAIERSESDIIAESTVIYFKDVYDHTIQIIDTIESLRDVLSGMLDIYLSSVSNRMNEVMKTLTIIATIFMPLTFIVGVYGMNFKNMPELELSWGYYSVLALMFFISIAMLLFFRRKKWL